MNLFENISSQILVTGGALVVLCVVFFLMFLAPGIRHLFRLRAIKARLDALENGAPLSEIKMVFTEDVRLAHLWKEYQDSLHVQREERDGQLVTTAVRSTIPSESYFSNQFVVDSRLRTEFFKHLPGIFTGIGIIGTFSGLIEGLKQFRVNENPASVRAMLESLMHSVGEAFLISAAAITAAMLVTLIEKLLLSALYRLTEDIAHAIDARFDAGAGEEYLSRLVKASEDSASQSKILKDALVSELGEILRELTSAQIDASREETKTLGNVIAESIQNSLHGPLQDLADTVKIASGDQSSAAVQMLNDVMVSFSQRLNDLFGGQISGLNELNKQTAQGMQDAVSALNTLVAKLEDSGKRSSDEMAAQMASTMKVMEERQASINAETQTFVEQIRKLVENSQTDTQQKLQSTLENMGQQMSTILVTLGDSQSRVFEDSRIREQSMSDRTQGMITHMADTVDTAVKEMSEASKVMAQSVASLAMTTTSSIDKMNTSAERISNAAISFATAGDGVTNVMEQVAIVSSKLTELTGSLTVSASSVQDGLRDYRAQRESVGQLLADLRATVEMARAEASMTGDVLKRIEGAAEKLGIAQKAADEYLDGVSSVLAASSEAFSESVTSTLAKVNHEFHTKLSESVGLLSSTVQDLEVTLGSLSPKG